MVTNTRENMYPFGSIKGAGNLLFSTWQPCSGKPGTKAVKLLVGPTNVKSHDQLKGAI